MADFARSPFFQELSAPNHVDDLLFLISAQENTAEEVLVYYLATLCHGVLAYDPVPSSQRPLQVFGMLLDGAHAVPEL